MKLLTDHYLPGYSLRACYLCMTTPVLCEPGYPPNVSVVCDACLRAYVNR